MQPGSVVGVGGRNNLINFASAQLAQIFLPLTFGVNNKY